MATPQKALSIPNSQDFISGKEYHHRTGEIVRFKDNSWCIEPRAGKRTTLYFNDLPKWLVRPAKLTIAHGWLTEGKSIDSCKKMLTSFTRIDKYLENFTGNSIADLTNEHIAMLHLRFDADAARYDEEMERVISRIGRSPTFRERRQVCMSLGLTNWIRISSCVSAFNRAAQLCEEIDGLVVTVRLHGARSKRFQPKGPGSADPNKVLSAEQIAELERALSRDLRRYDKARARIQKELGHLDLRSVERRTRYSGFDVLRYFGFNGYKEHTTIELSELRGLGPNSAPEVPRRIRRFLSPIIGTKQADEIVKLRSRFENLRKRKEFAELAAAQEHISSVLAGIDFSIHDKKAYCVERYFGLKGCRIQSMSTIQSGLGLETYRSVHNSIRARLTLFVGERKTKRLLAIRRGLRMYLSRAIKAQALRLQLAVARRISAVVEIPVEPPMRVRSSEGRRIVEIQFRSGKTWGDQGLLEWVPCVDRFAEIAEDAIHTAQRLTKDLRVVADENLKKQLFIIPDKSFDLTVPLSVDVLHQYIHVKEKGKRWGVLRRYSLEGLYDFEFHHVRHTHSTHMIEEGGSIQDIAHYLGHTSCSGSSAMAAVFYLAGGTEQMRKRTADALRKGAATGNVFDGVARLKIEALGSDAKKEEVPANQLSFEEARERILHADIIEDIPIEPAEAGKLARQKVVFNITRYGGCLLQAISGHCPTANPCPIGILPKGVEPVLGCGCKYLVLLPHSTEQLKNDIAVMEAQLSEMSGDQWAGWRTHTEAKLSHYRLLLETANALHAPKEENYQL